MTNNSGIVTIPADKGVAEIITRLTDILQSHGVTIYARIDQKAEAEKAGLSLKPLELLIFGNPKGGIPLMQQEPLTGLDLPLKAMAWEDQDGKTWLSYNSFSYLQERYSLPDHLILAVSAVEKLIKQAALTLP
jgi:uncharacterized protein (DUF302 family)